MIRREVGGNALIQSFPTRDIRSSAYINWGAVFYVRVEERLGLHDPQANVKRQEKQDYAINLHLLRLPAVLPPPRCEKFLVVDFFPPPIFFTVVFFVLVAFLVIGGDCLRILAGFFRDVGLGDVVARPDFFAGFLACFLADDVAFLGDDRLCLGAGLPKPKRSGIEPADAAGRFCFGALANPNMSPKLTLSEEPLSAA